MLFLAGAYGQWRDWLLMRSSPGAILSVPVDIRSDAERVRDAFLSGRIQSHEFEALMGEVVLGVRCPWEDVRRRIWPDQYEEERERPAPRNSYGCSDCGATAHVRFADDRCHRCTRKRRERREEELELDRRALEIVARTPYERLDRHGEERLREELLRTREILAYQEEMRRMLSYSSPFLVAPAYEVQDFRADRYPRLREV